MLVEDNPGDVVLLREMLDPFHSRDSDYELAEAPRLASAIKHLQESDFDVVLLDLSLPDSQGIATVARVKDAWPNVPIVVLTGYDDDNIATDALRRGAQDYLVKGQIDRRMLLRAMRYAIERQRSEEQLRRQREQETALRDVAEAVASTLDLDTVLNLFLDKFASLFSKLAFTARLVDPKTGSLDPFAFRNVEEIGLKSGPSAYQGVRARAIMALGKPLVLVDLLSDPHLGSSNFIKRNGFVSYAGIPLIAKGNSIGVIGVYSKERREFERDEVEFFSALGRQAAVAIYNSRIHEQAISAHERESVLRKINSALASTLDHQQVLKILLDRIEHLFPNYAVTVRLCNRETGVWDGVACRNINEADWRSSAIRSGTTIADAVAMARKPLAVANVQTDPRIRNPDFMRHNGLVSYAGMPMIVQDEVIGVLGFYTNARHEFYGDELELLATLAGQAAVAIHNSQLYDRLKDSNESLEKALEQKSILTGVMAHELKTPIQVILGSASMLADNLIGELTPEQRRSVRVIETGAGELLELIDHTLQMARLEHGRMMLAVTEVGVCALLAELKVEFEGPFREKGVELEIDALSPGIMAIKTDRIKLKEILRNLIDNARKYTPQGKVAVRAAKIAKDRVEFTVSDTGVGVREDLLPKIFDLFYQVSYLDKEKASAGLGLSIVKRLVESLSGEIEVSSEVGKGTTFRIGLPREIASEQPDGPRPHAR